MSADMNQHDFDERVRSLQQVPGLSDSDRTFLLDVSRDYWSEVVKHGHASADDRGHDENRQC